MKLYAPRYYKNFACIADKCRHSCCIGWEIDVDPVAMKKYASAESGYGKTVRDSIDPHGEPHFALAEGERCPHLDDRGLCKIITAMGEGYLCDICREHPRFYLDTPRGREVGLGMACEEACRLILSSDEYADFVSVGEVEGNCALSDFDAVAEREKIYQILLTPSLRYAQKREKICKEYGISLSRLTAEEWRACLASLEYLDEAHRALFSCFTLKPSVDKGNEQMLDRALAYYIYRHATEAADEAAFRAFLLLALFFEALLASLFVSLGEESREGGLEMARILSEELEYSEDNLDDILFEIETRI